jgi:hypothetical protein
MTGIVLLVLLVTLLIGALVMGFHEARNRK